MFDAALPSALAIVACCTILIWLYLLLFRGMFWHGVVNDDSLQPTPAAWPPVSIIVPARNEADVVARALGSLVAQDYPGLFRIVLVDDQSADGTVAAASAAAGEGGVPLEILRGAPLPAGWTGKLWALSQGIERACTDAPTYLLLTDADIAHAPDALRRLVARAEAGDFSLVSLMARLNCTMPAERLMIPAFVFFFQMLFPFSRVNDPKRRTAAGAGGCMLVRRAALEEAGGVAQIRRAIIDDCALATLLKRRGAIWIGLTDRAVSLRPYLTLAEIGRMIARSAFAQLGYSSLVLVGAVLGMALAYLAPPALALFANGLAQTAGAFAWALMFVAFQPTLRLYRQSPLWALALPLIAAIYLHFTVQSAMDYWRGRGGMWKGRAQAMTGSG
jgi:hopene-associated glycosyltransferase HpnB